MAIATIYTFPHTEEDFRRWSFEHMSHHRDIIRAIAQKGGPRLDEYVLDPFDPEDMSLWLDRHEAMHQQMDTVLGIAQNQLDELNWKDHEESANWFMQHGNEHFQAGTILQLG